MMCVWTARSIKVKPCATSTSQNVLPHSVIASPPPDIVHQHVKPAVLFTHAREERFNLTLDGVIGAHRDAAPARGRDELGGLIDCFVSSGRRRLSANASSAAIHRGPCLSERTGDPASGTSSRARDYRYFLLECFHGGSICDAEHGHHLVAGILEDVAVRHPSAGLSRRMAPLYTRPPPGARNSVRRAIVQLQRLVLQHADGAGVTG